MDINFEQLFIKVDNNEQEVLDFIKDCKPTQLLKIRRDGRTLLHKAIESLNANIIEALVKKNRQLLFINDANGLSPLACALKKYYDCRSMMGKSVVNQIYFKLQKDHERNSAVNQHVNISGQFAFFYQRLWQHGLELCFKRDAKRQIVDVDKDWIDFVVQVVNDGLYVQLGLLAGADVDKELMLIWVANKYPKNVYEMFCRAVDGQQTGLTARTITQMTINPNLTNSLEMMSRVNVSLPLLKTASKDPKEQKILGNKDIIWHYESKLYYQDKTSVTEINPHNFSSDKQDSYAGLNKIFSQGNVNRDATLEEARHVFNVKPMPTPVVTAQESAKSTATVTPRSLRGLPRHTMFQKPSEEVPTTENPAFRGIGDNKL